MDALEEYLKAPAPAASGGEDPLVDYLSGDDEPERTFLRPGRRMPYKVPARGDVDALQRERKANEERYLSPVEAVTGAAQSFADRATFGGYGGLLRSTAVEDKDSGFESLSSTALKNMEKARAVPWMTTASDVGAYLTKGPVALMDAISAMRGVRSLSPLPRAIATGATASGVHETAQAVSEGASPAETVNRASDAVVGGAAAATGLGALVKGAGAVGRAVQRSRGGRAREFIEKRGGELVPERTPDDADIGEAANRAGERAKEAMRGYQERTARDPYNAAVASVPQELAEETVDVMPVYRWLKEAAADPANLQVQGRLQEYLSLLESRMTKPAPQPPMARMPPGARLPPPAPFEPTIPLSHYDLNGLRRSMAGFAGVGDTNVAAKNPLRQAYGMVKQMVDDGPYAEANRIYHEGLQDVDESLDMVGLRRSTDPSEPIKGNFDIRAQRAGQNTVTAGRDRPGVEQFREKHPDIAAETIDQPEMLRNQADIAFKLMPRRHGGLIERTGSAAGGLALAELGMQLASHGHVSLAKAAMLLLGGLTLKNMAPINARLLYKPALAAQQLEPLILGDIPLLSAARALPSGAIE